MIMSDELFQLIADLQRDASTANGRRRLLDYIRARSGARLALLYVLHESGDALVLLDQRGRDARSQKTEQPAFAHAESISLNGLFGAALHTGKVMHISRAAADARTLDSERAWLAADDDVLVCRVSRRGAAKGVLALCLPSSAAQKMPPSDEDALLFCSALLSAYMTPEEQHQAPTRARLAVAAQAGAPAASEAAAIEQERARIARDLHDGVVQQLAAVLQRLELARRALESRPDAARQPLDEATLLINESLTELRHAIASPIPLQLEEQGLTAALRKLAQETTRAEPSLRVEIESSELCPLPVALEAAVYRLVQESLANARKHAQATRVVIRLRLVSRLLVVEISDNGQGFAPEAAGSVDEHLGLRMMRSRVQQAGGTWEAQSRCGEGTTIKARFPLSMPLPTAALTNREREVLRLLMQGLTNRAIAEKLSVSAETVKSHLHHIMQKMQVHDRTQAAVTAALQKLV
jgi:signal transduction histidine kinase/DNA-binding CsgD family transcriptional regulator